MSFLFDYLINLGLDPSSPVSVLWFVFKWGGFIFVFWAIFIGLREVWLNWRQSIFASKLEQVFLAIDVPKENDQSFKAVEQIFNNLWGAIKSPDFIEKYWKGYFQPNFSLELVSIEGYIQYIIRTPKLFWDLVEAAVYAQYPDAQITPIEDYTQGIDSASYQTKNYDLWGAQFTLVNEEVYPIKTYPLFEHPISQVVVDPIAAVLELFSRMHKGEQAWLQIVIKPISDAWKEKSQAKIKDLIGAPAEKLKLGLVDKTLDFPSKWVSQLGDKLFFPVGSIEKKEEKMEIPSKMLYLSPGERGLVEAIDRKSDKPGFRCKIRYIYLVKNTKLVKTKGVSGFVGVLKQYALLNSNGFKLVKGISTKAEWWQRKKVLYKKQKKILDNYKSRSSWAGGDEQGFILNTEELASIYHFPLSNVVAPTVKTVQAKRGEAPMSLPVEREEIIEKNSFETQNVAKTVAPPDNLPI